MLLLLFDCWLADLLCRNLLVLVVLAFNVLTVWLLSVWGGLISILGGFAFDYRLGGAFVFWVCCGLCVNSVVLILFIN